MLTDVRALTTPQGAGIRVAPLTPRKMLPCGRAGPPRGYLLHAGPWRGRRTRLADRSRERSERLAKVGRVDGTSFATRRSREVHLRAPRYGGQPSRGLPAVAHALLASVSEGWRGGWDDFRNWLISAA
jgi:hypothetical protein